MNDKIKNHIKQYCNKQGWTCETDKDLIETLQEASEVAYTIGSEHRWYDDVEIVVELDGMYIQYDWYHTTGDLSPADMDLDFDLNSIIEVVPQEVTTIKYVAVE